MQILAVVADNATNNNTMMAELETLFCRVAIPFSAKRSCLWCTPHTVHLSAIKVGAQISGLCIRSCSIPHNIITISSFLTVLVPSHHNLPYLRQHLMTTKHLFWSQLHHLKRSSYMLQPLMLMMEHQQHIYYLLLIKCVLSLIIWNRC